MIEGGLSYFLHIFFKYLKLTIGTKILTFQKFLHDIPFSARGKQKNQGKRQNLKKHRTF